MKQSNRISQVLLERLAQGELSDEKARALREKLAASGEDPDALLASLRASDEAILQQLPPRVVAAEVNTRLRRRPRSTRGAWFALPVAATALGAWMLLTRPQAELPLHTEAPEEIVLRGLKTHLVIYRGGDGEPQRLSRQDRARPGDLIQVAYVVQTDEAGPKYGVIASIDDRAQVTMHLPATLAAAERLDTTRGEVRLPNAFELDATPGKERFVFVVSSQPFRAEAVREALLGRGAMPAGSRQTEFVLQKESAP